MQGRIAGRWCAFCLATLAFGNMLRAADPYRWANAPIVGGGFVSGLVANPAAAGVIYARTDIGGAYRWDAGANQWHSISHWITADDWNYTGTESIAVDPSDANRVYIAAGSYTSDWAGNGAILRSSDRGDTWQITPLPFKNGGNEDGRNNGERLTVNPHNGAVLFFGSRKNGLWRSSDRGVSWQAVEQFPGIAKSDGEAGGQGINFVLFDQPRGSEAADVVYAGVSTTRGENLFCSSDGGESWRAVPGQPTGLRPQRAAVGRPGVLYITYSDAPGPNGTSDGAVYRFDAAGNRWTNVTPAKPGEDRFSYEAVAVDARHPETVMVSTLDRWSHGDEIYRSTDGGKTWRPLGPRAHRDFSAAPWGDWNQTPAPNGPLGHWISSILIDPFDSDHVMYTTGWGVWGSHDVMAADRGQATHWAIAAQGIEEGVINNVVSPPAGAPLLSVMWDINGFRHEDLHRVPRLFLTPDHGSNFGLDFAEQKPAMLARVYGNATGGATSNDDGVTWTPFASHPTGAFNGAIALGADGGSMVWSPGEAPASVSRDGGGTWTRCTGLPAKAVVVSDRNRGGQFYAFDSGSGAIYASSDGGVSFVRRASGLPHGDGTLRSTPGQDDLWLASGGGLYCSHDGGGGFGRVDFSVESANKIGFGKPAEGRDYPAIFISGHRNHVYGLFRSDDRGRTWEMISDPQHNFGGLNAISGDPRVFGRVYLASTSFGIVYGEPN
jgi:hypothetical protein